MDNSVVSLPYCGEGRDLDVDSPSPGLPPDTKGTSVLRLKGYVSWVYTAVTQVGFYLLREGKIQDRESKYERTGFCEPLADNDSYVR